MSGASKIYQVCIYLTFLDPRLQTAKRQNSYNARTIPKNGYQDTFRCQSDTFLLPGRLKPKNLVSHRMLFTDHRSTRTSNKYTTDQTGQRPHDLKLFEEACYTDVLHRQAYIMLHQAFSPLVLLHLSTMD
jgi:hypothetical protein